MAEWSGSGGVAGETPEGWLDCPWSALRHLDDCHTAGLAEGLGSALRLDLTMLREVFSQTGADSRVLKTDGENMQNRDHSCFFSGAHAAKDSGIALPLAEASKKQYDRMVSEGFGDLDKSGVAELTFPGRGKK